MKIYKIAVAETDSLARDSWLISAKSLTDAVNKSVQKMKRRKYYEDFEITSAEEIGELG